MIPAVESLEQRLVPSGGRFLRSEVGGVRAWQVEGVVHVVGTRDRDEITVLPASADGAVVVMADTYRGRQLVRRSRFEFESVVAIAAFLGRGNDQFANLTTVIATVDGGPGDDTLIGGGEYDVLMGGPGTDHLEPNGLKGNDYD